MIVDKSQELKFRLTLQPLNELNEKSCRLMQWKRDRTSNALLLYLEQFHWLNSPHFERRITSNLEGSRPVAFLCTCCGLRSINAPTRKQSNFRLKLIANKSAQGLKLIANRLKLIANGLAIIQLGSNYLQIS